MQERRVKRKPLECGFDVKPHSESAAATSRFDKGNPNVS